MLKAWTMQAVPLTLQRHAHVADALLSNFAAQAVLDRETGLVWERAPSTKEFTQAPPPGVAGGIYAQEHCLDLRLGGRMGWRVPSVVELASLVDPTQYPMVGLPAGHPFTLGFQTSFWSSTPYYPTRFPDAHRYVDFSTALTGVQGGAGATLPVWCVRSGAGEAQY